MLTRGQGGLTPNYDLARGELEKVAELNSSWAFYELGRLFEKGLGVEQNLEEAEKMFSRAQAIGFQGSRLDAVVGRLLKLPDGPFAARAAQVRYSA
jgi:TPR repeat protein